jgi:hypothetical protein
VNHVLGVARNGLGASRGDGDLLRRVDTGKRSVIALDLFTQLPPL